MAQKIIFVDKNINIIASLMLNLMPAGVQADIFVSAKEALKYLREHPVNIVICGMNTEDLDGVDFLKQIQSLYPEIYRVVFSSSTCLDVKTKEACENRTVEQWFDKVNGAAALMKYIKAFECNEQYFVV